MKISQAPRLIVYFAAALAAVSVVLAQNPPASTAAPTAAVVTVPPAFVLANNQFALDFLRAASPSSSENVFFSPYSISTALAMTWAGARGDTAAQMAQVLHFSKLPEKEVPVDFGLLQQALARVQTKTNSQLAVANSLWPEQNPEQPFLPEYLNLVQSAFGSSLAPVDFKNNFEQARQRINDWVEGKTNSRIKNLLHQGDVDASTRLVLVNAIYFKGAWASCFRADFNVNDKFHLADGSAKPVVLMDQDISTYPATAKYGDFPKAVVPFQMLSMNYYGDKDDNQNPTATRDAMMRGTMGDINVRGGGDLSFVVLLPRKPNALADLEKSLTAEQIDEYFKKLENTKVEVFLPKFKLEERYQLTDTLQKLGIKNAFIDPIKGTTGADFSGMNGIRDLYISNVIHQTFLDVDENGTEAAAATAVLMMTGAAAVREAPPPVFRADHPFLFMIRENTTGSILFLGRFAGPQ